MGLFRRRPRWRVLRRQQKYWLRADQVPQAPVELEPACVDRFNRFDALRREVAPEARLPVEIYVLLTGEGPGVTAWTEPSDRLEATLVGRLSGAAAARYEAVLAGLPDDHAPFAQLIAHELAPGRWSAIVEGFPPGEPFQPPEE